VGLDCFLLRKEGRDADFYDGYDGLRFWLRKEGTEIYWMIQNFASQRKDVTQIFMTVMMV